MAYTTNTVNILTNKNILYTDKWHNTSREMDLLM